MVNDGWQVRQVAAEAIARARRGEGPTLIEAETYRFRGHSLADPDELRSKEEKDYYLVRCNCKPLSALEPSGPPASCSVYLSTASQACYLVVRGSCRVRLRTLSAFGPSTLLTPIAGGLLIKVSASELARCWTAAHSHASVPSAEHVRVQVKLYFYFPLLDIRTFWTNSPGANTAHGPTRKGAAIADVQKGYKDACQLHGAFQSAAWVQPGLPDQNHLLTLGRLPSSEGFYSSDLHRGVSRCS